MKNEAKNVCKDITFKHFHIRMKTKSFYLVIILLTSTFFQYSLTIKKIDRQQAIKLAKDFIRRNGYTTALADTSRYKLSYEFVDDFSTHTILERRHNTLWPQASYIARFENGWHIGFLSVSVQQDKLNSKNENSDLPGRSVSVNDDGSIKIDHRTPLFSKFEKL